MMTLPVYEAKTRLSELLTAVEQGEQVVITRHGQAVAKLVAVEPANESDAQMIAQRRTAIEAVIKAREGRSLEGLDYKALMEEGRD